MLSTNFLGSLIDNHLNWRNPTKEIIPKLSGACYAVRSKFRNSNFTTLKWIYFAYFNSVMKYGIIVGVILPLVGGYSLYKWNLSALGLVNDPELHIEVCLKNWRFLAFSCQYVFLLMNLFFANRQANSQTNSFTHSINPRNKHYIHIWDANQWCLLKSTFCGGIRIFDSLLCSLTILRMKS
jgi:hypothetical protein